MSEHNILNDAIIYKMILREENLCVLQCLKPRIYVYTPFITDRSIYSIDIYIYYHCSAEICFMYFFRGSVGVHRITQTLGLASGLLVLFDHLAWFKFHFYDQKFGKKRKKKFKKWPLLHKR